MYQQLLYKIKKPFHFVKTGLLNGLKSELQYQFPAKKLKIITITGTDGKTTSSTLLYHVLKTADKKVGLLSTVAAYLGAKAIDTGFHVTSPQPSDLHKFMREMVDDHYEYLILEVTSHGSYQYRDWGIKPILSGLTNIANEHLDYHVNYEEYLNAKTQILSKAPTAVVNSDDYSYQFLRKKLNRTNLITYSQDSELPKKVALAIKKRFPENYNQMNSKLVYALSKLLHIDDKSFVQAIETFQGIPGRMQVIPNRKKINLVVDFAHTPQGLRSVLRFLREQMQNNKNPGKLIAVFGCAGQRDAGKRPEMGKIATKLADLAVFTAEDPRNEDVWSIIRQMKENLTHNHSKIVSIADRGEAIDFTINELAKPGDTVVVLGKGHEQSMCYFGVEYPWNDAQAIEKILAGQHPRVKEQV
jgi:UDP-N-acetylmuramoyl-L-alanyl-D-glutamate--2,6-diaminopimelate ligase